MDVSETEGMEIKVWHVKDGMLIGVQFDSHVGLEYNMKLYHRDVFMPRGIRKQFGQLAQGLQFFHYSNHARTAAQNDRYGVIVLTNQLQLDTMELIEVEHNGNKITKVVIREVGQEKNRVWAIIPISRSQWLVKTVWYNLANDKHNTLNTTPYEKPTK